MTAEEKIEKMQGKLDPNFLSEIKIADKAKLKEMVVQLSKKVEDIVDAQKSDGKLNALREQLKDLSSGYRDAKKEQNTRLKFILLTLQLRGDL